MATSTHIPLSEDTALVAALAGTAMAFSNCAEDEAERWLRALRLHGTVGVALQGIGVGEAPLERDGDVCDEPSTSPPLGQAALERALRRAEQLAESDGAETVGTPHLLRALFDVYGASMNTALEVRGSSRDEVLERVANTGVSRPQK